VDLSRRVRHEQLKPLEHRFAKELLSHDSDYPHLVNLANQVYGLAAGYPLGHVVVQHHLRELLDQGEWVDHETFSVYEQSLLDDLVQETINDYAFLGIDSSLVAALRVLALLRQFDVPMLQRLLPSFIPEFSDYPSRFFSGMLTTLHIQTHVIEWNNENKAHRLLAPLRQILQRHMRQHDLGRYIAINRAALEENEKSIGSARECRDIFLAEILYHQAIINRVASASLGTIETINLMQRMCEHLACYFTLESYRANQDLLCKDLECLEQRLRQDVELGSLLEGESVETSALCQCVSDYRYQVIHNNLDASFRGIAGNTEARS
jgi:hypothetical protein